MIAKIVLVGALAIIPLAQAQAAEPDRPAGSAMPATGIPAQLDDAQRDGYRGVFASIRDQRWIDAQIQLDSMKPGPLHAIARAELLTAKGSPKAALDPLVQLLSEAPNCRRRRSCWPWRGRAARSICRHCRNFVA